MGHAHTPPELPEITDEAGDTPKWVPWLGVALFIVGVGCVVLRHTGHDGDAEPDVAAEPAP